MRIFENSQHRLVMRGVPGGAGAAWFAVAVGIGLGAVTGTFGVLLASRGHTLAGAAAMLGVVMGLFASAFGARRLLSRESLVFEHGSGRGVHESWGIGRPGSLERIEFEAASIAAVVLQRRETEHRSDGTTVRIIHWNAILRLEEPRRAIVLAETQNGRELAVRAVAVAVAEAFGLPVVEDLSEAEGDEEVVDTEEFTTPLARRTDGAIEMPPQPAGSRIEVEIDERAPVVRLRWRIMGNNVLPWIGAVIFGGWTVISVVFLLASLGVIGGGATRPGSSAWVVTAMSVAFVAIGVVLTTPMVVLIVGAKRTVTITPEWVEVRSPVRIGNARAARGAVTTVRMASGDDDAAIVFCGDRKVRIGLHLPVDGEVKWLTAAVRAGVRAMG